MDDWVARDGLVVVACIQRMHQRFVASVYIGVKTDMPIRVGLHCRIRQQDRYWLGQIDVAGDGGRRFGRDGGLAPFGVVIEQQFDQFERAFDPNTARAERALRRIE